MKSSKDKKATPPINKEKSIATYVKKAKIKNFTIRPQFHHCREEEKEKRDRTDQDNNNNDGQRETNTTRRDTMKTSKKPPIKVKKTTKHQPASVATEFPKADEWHRDGKFHGKVIEGPTDLTPMSDEITQDIQLCAAGKRCLMKGQEIPKNYRCVSCGFGHHRICGAELLPTKTRSVKSSMWTSTCFGCCDLRNFNKLYKFKESGAIEGISLRRKAVHEMLDLQFNDLILINRTEEFERVEKERQQEMSTTTREGVGYSTPPRSNKGETVVSDDSSGSESDSESDDSDSETDSEDEDSESESDSSDESDSESDSDDNSDNARIKNKDDDEGKQTKENQTDSMITQKKCRQTTAKEINN